MHWPLGTLKFLGLKYLSGRETKGRGKPELPSAGFAEKKLNIPQTASLGITCSKLRTGSVCPNDDPLYNRPQPTCPLVLRSLMLASSSVVERTSDYIRRSAAP